MNIKTSQTITVTERESYRMDKTMDFIENLIYEMAKFTITDDGEMINENGTTIVNKSDLIKTYNTLNNLMWFLGDTNDDRTTPISFIK